MGFLMHLYSGIFFVELGAVFSNLFTIIIVLYFDIASFIRGSPSTFKMGI